MLSIQARQCCVTLMLRAAGIRVQLSGPAQLGPAARPPISIRMNHRMCRISMAAMWLRIRFQEYAGTIIEAPLQRSFLKAQRWIGSWPPASVGRQTAGHSEPRNHSRRNWARRSQLRADFSCCSGMHNRGRLGFEGHDEAQAMCHMQRIIYNVISSHDKTATQTEHTSSLLL